MNRTPVCFFRVVIILILFFSCNLICSDSSSIASNKSCVECHLKTTGQIVSDWKLSAHSENDVDCVACHGDQHMSKEDADKAKQEIEESFKRK